jgi:hypothetical protein
MPKRLRKITKSQYRESSMKLNDAQTSESAEPPTMIVRYYRIVRSLPPSLRAQFDL